MKKNNGRRTCLIVLIIIMLAAIAAIGYRLAERGESLNEASRKETSHALADLVNSDIAAARPDADSMEEAAAALHIYSHRGSAGENEHSFTAYDEAISAGSQYIEQDVVLSADGVLYVSHDLSAYAMTGNGAYYSSMESSEIDQLRTGAGNKILRLSEVFDRYGADIRYVIELKSKGAGTISAFEDIVDSYGYQDRIIVQSDETDVLGLLDEKYPDMPKLFICKSWESFLGCLDKPYVDIISVRAASGLMNERCVAEAHEHGKLFSAWTLDSESDIREAIRLGVDTYFTNDTALAMQLEKELRCHVNLPRTSTFLFFASDYQAEPGWQSPEDSLTEILRQAAADGRSPDNIIFCGDYTNDARLYDYQVSPDDSIAEIREVIAKECEYASQDDIIFIQGNHDRLTDEIADSGLHEFDDYLVYVLNTQNDFPWKQGKVDGSRDKVVRAAEELKTCLDELIEQGEARPLFIAGHVPLHFTARTSSKHTTGDNMYASYIFNVVNEAAAKLDIVYLTGHNHSKGWDCYMGGSTFFRSPGDTVLIPDAGDGSSTGYNAGYTDNFTEETLAFTYMNAGYTGYYMNCGTEELNNGTQDQYHAADETLTAAVCEITGDELILTRYSGDGVHELGHAGEADPYKGGIDTGLIDSKYYGKAVDSPVHIERRVSR